MDKNYIEKQNSKKKISNTIDLIISSTSDTLKSILNQKIPEKTDVFLTVILNSPKEFNERIAFKLKEEETTERNCPKIRGDFDTIVSYYYTKNEKYRFFHHLMEVKTNTEYYVNLLKDSFSALKLSDDKLIDGLLLSYTKKTSEDLKEANIKYYNICAESVRKSGKNSPIFKGGFYFEFGFEDFLSLFCGLIHVYLGLTVKLIVDKKSKERVYLLMFSKEEEVFERLAEKYRYQLQLKPYAIKYEEVEKEKNLQRRKSSLFSRNEFNLFLNQSTNALNSKAKLERKLTLTSFSKREDINFSSSIRNFVEDLSSSFLENYKDSKSSKKEKERLKLKNMKSSKLLYTTVDLNNRLLSESKEDYQSEEDRFNVPFYLLNQNNSLYFPPYHHYEKSKNSKFRRYLKDGSFHICPDDKDFFPKKNPTANTGVKVPDKNVSNCVFGCSKFRNIDKIRLMHRSLVDLIDVNVLHNKKLLLNLTFNFRPEETLGLKLGRLFVDLIKIYDGRSYLKTVETVRNLFGEKYSFYFLFIVFLSRRILFLSVVGVVVFIVVYDPPMRLNTEIDAFSNFRLDYYDFSLITFCVLIALWGILCLESWRQKERLFRYFWGVEKREAQQTPNDKFIPDKTEPFLLDENISVVIKIIKKLKFFSSFSVILLLIFFRVLLLFFFTKNVIINEYTLKNVLVNAVFSYFIKNLMSKLNFDLCQKLTEWENHKTKTEQINYTAIKTVIFDFVNNYCYLFFIAFYKPYLGDSRLSKCYNSNCLKELEVTLYTHLTMDFLVTFFGTIISKVQNNIYKKQFKIEYGQNMYNILPYKIYNESIDDLVPQFNEKIMRLGYILFFSVSAPLTPVIVLALNLVGCYKDLYEMLFYYRIGNVEQASGIGIYESIIKVFYFLGLMSNISIVLFTSPKLAKLDLYIRKKITQNDDFIIKSLILTLMENLLLIIMNVIEVNFSPLWFNYVSELKDIYFKRYYYRE